ncbi:hypothetical protein DITRI_Ditri05aG0114000 [Diplodiscus trichospermus]
MAVKVLSEEVERRPGKEVNPGHQVTFVKTEPRFKAKDGSLFPNKKRSVKKMMLDWMINSLSTLLARSISN